MQVRCRFDRYARQSGRYCRRLREQRAGPARGLPPPGRPTSLASLDATGEDPRGPGAVVVGTSTDQCGVPIGGERDGATLIPHFPTAPSPTSLSAEPYSVETAHKDPGGSDAAIVAADDGDVTTGRQRDGCALFGFAHGADADQLVLPGPRPAWVKIHAAPMLPLSEGAPTIAVLPSADSATPCEATSTVPSSFGPCWTKSASAPCEETRSAAETMTHALACRDGPSDKLLCDLKQRQPRANARFARTSSSSSY